jgi:hypothetical protein
LESSSRFQTPRRLAFFAASSIPWGFDGAAPGGESVNAAMMENRAACFHHAQKDLVPVILKARALFYQIKLCCFRLRRSFRSPIIFDGLAFYFFDANEAFPFT